MVKTKEDLTGKQFERLIVIRQTEDYIEPNGKCQPQWICKCLCGNPNEVIAMGKCLKNKSIQSCGCLKREYATKTGLNNKKENKFDFDSEEYAIGYTLKGEPFWFDKEDYAKIKDYCWFYDKRGYVTATERKTKNTIFLHVFVMEPVPEGMIVDHKKHPPRNEHKIDNRKQNLEVKTQSQNMMNMSLPINNTSGMKGVSLDKRNHKWKAYIGINNKRINLGSFDNKDDAIQARKEAEVKYFGEYRYEVNN